jgi:glycoside/pentoside/hexuronide:cation symporter, GPH family
LKRIYQEGLLFPGVADSPQRGIRSNDCAMSLAFSRKVAYAAPAFALAVVGIPVYIYIPKFYTDVVGFNIGMLGFLLLAVRIFDAVTDPLLGYITDRSRTPFGRRRPYIAGGSLALAVSLFLLFNPPKASPTFETWWFGICIFSLFFFWTTVVVPYESLGPELTFDYHERTGLFGLRDGAMLAGTLVAASSPLIVSRLLGLPQDPEGERLKFFWISAIYGPMLIFCSWWCVLALRETTGRDHSSRKPIFQGLRAVAQNKPFLLLLSSYTIAAFGSNLPATLILYYVEYVLGSNQADLFLALYFVTGIVFLPAWVLLSRRLGKKWSWIASMGINTGSFLGVFFLGPGDVAVYGVLVFFSGIGLGATIAFPSAMQADVIDYDEFLTGDRREGQYIGLWSISKKLAAALGVGVSLSILSYAGYTPNVEQSETVRVTLRVLYALVPSAFNLLGLGIALFYPIGIQAHQEILAAIQKRKAGEKVRDPLRPERVLAGLEPVSSSRE